MGRDLVLSSADLLQPDRSRYHTSTVCQQPVPTKRPVWGCSGVVSLFFFLAISLPLVPFFPLFLGHARTVCPESTFIVVCQHTAHGTQLTL